MVEIKFINDEMCYKGKGEYNFGICNKGINFYLKC